MAGPGILPQSPSDKGRADMAEDIENGLNKGNAAAGNPRVEVTEGEVSIYPALQLERAPDKTFYSRIRESVAKPIKRS
jgi:hypothetical protein